MKARLEQLIKRINALTLRERLILTTTVIAALSYLWIQVFYSPVQKQITTAHTEISRIQGDLTTLTGKIVTLTNALNQDPNRAIRMRLEVLSGERKGILDQLQKSAEGLISPERMPEVLEALLRKNRNLKLLKLYNLDRVAIPVGTSESEDKETTPIIYKHALVMHLKGSYPDAVNYLKELEALPWQVFWESFQLDVTDYPNAMVKLELYTLSLNKEWIGV